MVNKSLWAKKAEKNGLFYWLPLYQHLEDTKDIAGFLWEHWLSEGQRTIITKSISPLSDDGGKNLAIFLAAIHDIGKATPAFQKKKGFLNASDLDILLLEKLERDGFNEISSVDLTDPEKSSHNIAGQYLLKEYGVKDDISAIVGAHHGKPVNSRKIITDQKAYKKNYYQSGSSDSDIYIKWAASQREIFDWALEESGFKRVEDLPKVNQVGQVLLSGLLIMADWIASNDSYFPLISVEQEDVSNREERCKIGFSNWQKTFTWSPDYNFDYIEMYQKRFGFTPRNFQAVLSDAINQSEQPGIFIVEAPMGSGKTEASLIAVEQLAYKTGRSGLFFGLPTQATSNGIFPRIISWLDSISKEQCEDRQLRLSHGKAHLNEKFIDLSKGVNIDEIDGNIIVNEWFSGRKTSALDDFVVGTVDQFLMLSLKQKHLALRHLGFSKKVVVIDEVHAYDSYMGQYLLQAVKWLGAYRVPVVILSATLPSERRVELVKNYIYGMGKTWSKPERDKMYDRLKTDDYPLITFNDGDDIYQIRDFEKSLPKEVNIIKLDEASLFETVDEMIADGVVVGIIVNTVKRAQQITREMIDRFGEEIVELLHSSFIATERVAKEDKLLQMIGSKADRPHRKIVIGTQVIEQSLDIDFDVMISDLAPMDLIIQRIGRLHRHNIDRPLKHKDARFYVMGTSEGYDFESGSSYVYGDFMLARTQYHLPECIQMPMDISVLVQKVYDFEDDLIVEDELHTKYQEFKKKHYDIINEKKSRAKTYRIEQPVYKKSLSKEDTLIGWLDNSLVDENEEKANAQVRDIEPTIEVIALKKVGSGYGIFGSDVDISKDVLEYQTAKKIAGSTIVLPRALSQLYNIDKTIAFLEKYTLSYLSTWQQSIWLKGALGIIFDENNSFEIDNYKLIYDEKYGLCVERM